MSSSPAARLLPVDARLERPASRSTGRASAARPPAEDAARLGQRGRHLPRGRTQRPHGHRRRLLRHGIADHRVPVEQRVLPLDRAPGHRVDRELGDRGVPGVEHPVAQRRDRASARVGRADVAHEAPDVHRLVGAGRGRRELEDAVAPRQRIHAQRHRDRVLRRPGDVDGVPQRRRRGRRLAGRLTRRAEGGEQRGHREQRAGGGAGIAEGHGHRRRSRGRPRRSAAARVPSLARRRAAGQRGARSARVNTGCRAAGRGGRGRTRRRRCRPR